VKSVCQAPVVGKEGFAAFILPFPCGMNKNIKTNLQLTSGIF